MVTHKRKCSFGKIINTANILYDLGHIANECWQDIPFHFTNVEAESWVIMPNHVHGIITILEDELLPGSRGTISGLRQQDRAPTIDLSTSSKEIFGKPAPGSLATIIRTYMAAVSRLAKRSLGMTNIWQRNYYEHIIRNEHELNEISNYISNNPQTWADDPESSL
jgi:putative transposase